MRGSKAYVQCRTCTLNHLGGNSASGVRAAAKGHVAVLQRYATHTCASGANAPRARRQVTRNAHCVPVQCTCRCTHAWHHQLALGLEVRASYCTPIDCTRVLLCAKHECSVLSSRASLAAARCSLRAVAHAGSLRKPAANGHGNGVPTRGCGSRAYPTQRSGPSDPASARRVVCRREGACSAEALAPFACGQCARPRALASCTALQVGNKQLALHQQRATSARDRQWSSGAGTPLIVRLVRSRVLTPQAASPPTTSPRAPTCATRFL